MNISPATTVDSATHAKLQQLRNICRGLGRTIVAYSGGVDSAFLLKVAREELGAEAVPVLGISPSLMPEEQAEALELGRRMGLEVRTVATHEMEDPNYSSNPNNRCYFCKSELFTVLTRLKAAEGFDSVCDGTNLDDMSDWRPGAKAAAENEVRSPLREAGMTKQDIRSLAREMGLPVWDKPAMPCLSSRIPYGTPVTAEALRMIGRAEAWLRSQGLRQVRVRHHMDGTAPTARIEVEPDDMARLVELRSELTAELRELGYTAVLLDLEGYRRGRLNESTSQPIQLILN